MNEYLLFVRSALVTLGVNAAGRFSDRYSSPRRILVVKLDHLGDVILVTPALRALREAHPGVPIDALVLPGSSVLLEGGTLVDGVIPYDTPRFRRPAAGAPPAASNSPDAVGESIEARAALLSALADRRYDWVVEFRGDEWTSGRLLRALRPVRRFDRGSVRLGDWIARRWGRLLGRRASPPLHEVETNLAVLRGAIPRPPDRPRVEAPPWPRAHDGLQTAAREAGLDLARPYVVIQPGASWSPRAWRTSRFAAVASELRTVHGFQIALLGVRSDTALETEFEAAGLFDAAPFWGTLGIPEVAALLRGARLFVGNDGGIAHLAATSDTPSVVLFGPTIASRFRPWSVRTRALQHAEHCDPACQLACVRSEPCVNLIATEDVLAAVRESLGPPHSSEPVT